MTMTNVGHWFFFPLALRQELREWHRAIPIVHIHNLRLTMAALSMSHRFDTAKALERVVLQHVTSQLMSQWYKAVTHGVSVMAVAVSQVRKRLLYYLPCPAFVW